MLVCSHILKTVFHRIIDMGEAKRFLSFPGNAHMPACRVREDSPHLRRLWNLAWRAMERQPVMEPRAIRAFDERDMETRELRLRSGFAFEATTTATILLRVVETMGSGKPCYSSYQRGSGASARPETRLFLSLLGLLEHMRKDIPYGQSDAGTLLKEQGILIRPRKVAIAVVPVGGGTWSPSRGVYLLNHTGIGIGKILMLNGRPDIVREIIRIEAAYEAGREGGPYEYSNEKNARISLMHLWQREVRMASYDMY